MTSSWGITDLVTCACSVRPVESSQTKVSLIFNNVFHLPDCKVSEQLQPISNINEDGKLMPGQAEFQN